MHTFIAAVKAVVEQRSVDIRRAAEAGMSTAEYAVGTVAACGFGAVLWAVVHSGTVQEALTGLVTKALNQL